MPFIKISYDKLEDEIIESCDGAAEVVTLEECPTLLPHMNE